MCSESFAKTETEIISVGAQDFLGKPLVHSTLMENQSCTQMRWCFLITCTSQFLRSQMCRYMPSQEKRKVKEFYSGLSDMTAFRESKELPMLQSLPYYVPSCTCLKRGFLFILSISCCCQRVTFWHCLLRFRA